MCYLFYCILIYIVNESGFQVFLDESILISVIIHYTILNSLIMPYTFAISLPVFLRNNMTELQNNLCLYFPTRLQNKAIKKNSANVATKCSDDKIFGNKTRSLFLRKKRSKEIWNSWLTFRSE